MKNKLFKLSLISFFILLIFGIIYFNEMHSNHNILLKLAENIKTTDFLSTDVDKKIYVTVYDGKEVKNYESDFNKKVSICLSEIEKKLDYNLYKKYVRLDITKNIYYEDELLEMSNSQNTLSFFYENGKVYDLTKYQIGKAKNIKYINLKENVLMKTYKYMLNQIKEDGTFVYGINLDSGTKSNDYNIIRHAGSLWSLLDIYNYLYKNGNTNDLKLMKSAYDYIYDHNLQKKDENTDFVFTDEDECKIGSNALMILASIELYNITGEKEYLDNSTRLANGIIYLQDDDGSFYHLTDKTFDKVGKNSSTIYNGENILALIRLYEKTQNEVYLNSVLKFMDSSIKKSEVNTTNQWFAYFYAELIKYVKDTKYIQDFISDMNSNLNKMDYKFNTTDMEYLGSCFMFLKEIIDNYDDYSLTNIASKEELSNLLSHVKRTYIDRAQKGLSNYATVENSMFFNDINSYQGAFFEDNYFARIDVSQHNLSGYRMFYELMYKNNKLINFGEDKNKKNADAYVQLAKKAVETYVRTGITISVPSNLPKEMYKKCKNGVFVGIHNQDELRGCKGTFEPTGSIAEEIIKYAIIAATNDERFSPINKNELNNLIYEVSILTEPEKVNSLTELDVVKYGIRIIKNDKKGTMLPNRDTISTVEEQIAKTLKKAGLSEDEKDYELYRFETISYKGK